MQTRAAAWSSKVWDSLGAAEMFERRRPATPAEIAELYASFDAGNAPEVLREAAVSVIVTLAELAAMHTALAIPEPRAGGDSFYTVAENERSWAAGGGSAHDQESYGRAVQQAADPTFAPPLLFAPTSFTSSGWWMVDGIHRAAALLTTRRAAGVTTIDLRVFALPRPLQQSRARSRPDARAGNLLSRCARLLSRQEVPEMATTNATLTKPETREVKVSSNRQVGLAADFARKLGVGADGRVIETLVRMPGGTFAVLLMTPPKSYRKMLTAALTGADDSRAFLKKLRDEWPDARGKHRA